MSCSVWLSVDGTDQASKSRNAATIQRMNSAPLPAVLRACFDANKSLAGTVPRMHAYISLLSEMLKLEAMNERKRLMKASQQYGAVTVPISGITKMLQKFDPGSAVMASTRKN